jgi:hypothetical protein
LNVEAGGTQSFASYGLKHAGSCWNCGLSCLSLKIQEMRRNRNLLKESGAGGSKRLNEKGAGTKLNVSV